MAPVAEHTRGARRDVARFLTEHESCASDFQIRRFDEAGRTGDLSVICNGCGERAGYELGEPGELKSVGSEAGEGPPGGGKVSREDLQRWLPAPAALPWWVPNAYIVAVILVGLAMIGFGVLRDRDGDHLFGGQGSGDRSAEEEQAGQEPAEEAAPEPAAAPSATARTGAATGGGGEKDSDGGQPPRIRAELDPVTVLGRFRIGVPSGWSGGMSGGAVVFRPAGEDAELRVFLESGAQPTRTLSREARDFLRREHPGARITEEERVRIGGDRAIRIGARYKGGEEWATVLSASGYSYLLLARLGGDAGERVTRQAEAALASFQAL